MAISRVAVIGFILLSGCSNDWDLRATGKLKYFVLKIDSEDRVIPIGSLNIPVKEQYYFGLPPFWQMDSINPDRENAIRIFIDYRGASPIECLNGYRIVKNGMNEGGATWAILECN